MEVPLKTMTDFMIEVGAAEVVHTEKGYLAHAIGVYNDLREWGCSEELARVGIFHSIYGTELFQGFTLPLEHRDDVRTVIGERAEWISYLNCCMDRAHFDAQVPSREGPYTILDRFENRELEVSEEDFHDLCVVHLVDWLEQVERGQQWRYRHEGYANLARRLGRFAQQKYDEVFANEPQAG